MQTKEVRAQQTDPLNRKAILAILAIFDNFLQKLVSLFEWSNTANFHSFILVMIEIGLTGLGSAKFRPTQRQMISLKVFTFMFNSKGNRNKLHVLSQFNPEIICHIIGKI